MLGTYSLERINVLVVDGNWHMRKLIGTMLQGFGIQNVEFVTDGREAMRKMLIFNADIVICEFQLDHVDGVELARNIRRAKKKVAPYLPIIMITGHVDESNITAARDAGVSAIVAKPVSAKVVFGRIVQLIENSRQFIRSPSFRGPDRRNRDLSLDPLAQQRRVSDGNENVA